MYISRKNLGESGRIYMRDYRFEVIEYDFYKRQLDIACTMEAYSKWLTFENVYQYEVTQAHPTEAVRHIAAFAGDDTKARMTYIQMLEARFAQSDNPEICFQWDKEGLICPTFSLVGGGTMSILCTGFSYEGDGVDMPPPADGYVHRPAVVRFLSKALGEGGRNRPPYSGYRPVLQVGDEYTSCTITLRDVPEGDQQMMDFGRQHRVYTRLLSEARLGERIKPGMAIMLYEGDRLVGTGQFDV